MKSRNIFGILLLAGGILLLNYGVQLSHRAPTYSFFIVGKLTYDTIWYVIFGGIFMILGMILVLAGFKGKPTN
jgi:Protein of unknown function (DUF3185)